jgi:hypothetical protein
MNTAIAKRSETQLARPLPVMVRLIKADIHDGDVAAKEASMPYYMAAGEKLREVRDGIKKDRYKQIKGNFRSWAVRTFQRSDSQITIYMKLAKQKKEKMTAGQHFHMPTTLREVDRPDRMTATVDINKRLVDDIKRAHPQIAQRVEQKQEEQEQLELDVALELISIGYRALAAKLHPDRNNGGSHDAMRTLNMIRDALRRFANKEWGC